MIQYAVIVENDETEWDDDTGVRYHFPQRYTGLLSPGTRILHYKGKMTNRAFRSKRLSVWPHYFGFSTAGTQVRDPRSTKGDLFLEILDYRPFEAPVLNRHDGELIEEIPRGREANYWRDGVRKSSSSVFEKVEAVAVFLKMEGTPELPDLSLTAELWEGDTKLVFGTRYEREPKLRSEAINIHGVTCLACETNFGLVYGDFANGYIHIHNKKPLSLTGPTAVNPATDLVPLCANCHAMVHHGRKLRSVNELRAALGKEAILLGD
jgi:putative restriction endonuclease